jgi:RNA polymerase sigma factor (sigma-70 family)
VSSEDLERFLRVRPRLCALARRVVGNVHEAEDVVQEVWVRWQRTDRAAVTNAEAFLATVALRLAVNVVTSARRRHETMWGEEPAGTGGDPPTETERAEAIRLAADLVVERLPPSERAAYVLREGFGYPYQQIATTLRIGNANARQLVTRARARIAAAPRRVWDSPRRGTFVRAFAAAAVAGELTELEAVLSLEGGRF